MKNLSFFNPLCLLSLLIAMLMGGCNLPPPLPTTEKVTGSNLEHPFFFLPPLNQNDFKDRHWILLAESTENNWFYDPYSLSEDEDNIVSFDAFISPRKISPRLNRFNASITGPYRQKIDCFGNHQWSEIFYADKMPAQETFINSKNPNLVYGWIKIKPKTAMAYIRARICGRKFLDDKNVNYFLFQEGRMKRVKPDSQAQPKPKAELKSGSKLKSESAASSQAPVDEDEELTPSELMVKRHTNLALLAELEGESTYSELNLPLFYEVINNEVIVINEKNDIREMKIASYLLDKDFPKLADYVFRANCPAKTYIFFKQGKPLSTQELGDSPESLANIAFDRICGDHGSYMKLNLQKGHRHAHP